MPVPPTSSKQIFVCYSRRDKEIVDHVVTQIEALGHVFWMDRSGLVGADRWRAVIVEALQMSGAILFFGSKHSFDSEHVAAELTLAQGEGIPIIPVFIDDSTPSGDIAYLIASLHRIRYSVPNDPSALQQIEHAASTKLGQKRTIQKPVPFIKTRKHNPLSGIASLLIIACIAAAVSWHFARNLPLQETSAQQPIFTIPDKKETPEKQSEPPPSITVQEDPSSLPSESEISPIPTEKIVPEPIPVLPEVVDPSVKETQPSIRGHSPGTVTPIDKNYEIED